MRTFREVKPGQYVYRVKLSDYSVKKIRVKSVGLGSFGLALKGVESVLFINGYDHTSYHVGNFYGYATCKESLRVLLQEQKLALTVALQRLY